MKPFSRLNDIRAVRRWIEEKPYEGMEKPARFQIQVVLREELDHLRHGKTSDGDTMSIALMHEICLHAIVNWQDVPCNVPNRTEPEYAPLQDGKGNINKNLLRDFVNSAEPEVIGWIAGEAINEQAFSDHLRGVEKN